MTDMSSIPGTPGWVAAKGGKSASAEKPVQKVEVTEAGKDKAIEVKPE